MTARRARPRAARAGRSDDPQSAFRRRAGRDCARIARLASRLRKSADWGQVGGPLQSLEQLAHALAGAGGMFGFEPVSAAAARVERLAERWRSDPPPRLTMRRVALLAKATDSLIATLRAAAAAG